MLVNIRIMHLNNVQYQEQMLGSLVSVIEALDYEPLMKMMLKLQRTSLMLAATTGLELKRKM